MKKVNVIIVYNESLDKILMCYRKKNPYKGKYNLVGGKVEENEEIEDAAYRELEEETGITKKDIQLVHLMDFVYYKTDLELEVFFGMLSQEVELIEEVNRLLWVDKNENFFDEEKYAGEGNIGHMVIHADLYKEKLLKDNRNKSKLKV